VRVFFTHSFLDDLRGADDARFVKRVLSQIFDGDGEFRRGQNDHRYHGIADAWIRYVSRGATQYRLIYLLKNDAVYLYRAGVHSIEDNLAEPQNLDRSVLVSSIDIQVTQAQPQDVDQRNWDPSLFDVGHLLKTTQETMLKKLVQGLFHVGHSEIILISPYVSEATVARRSPLGQFLDRAVEESTNVWLVTRPPHSSRLDFYRALEERNFGVYFYKQLHAKLYLFDVKTETLNEYNKDMCATAILGSANLTEMGLALTGELSNEELCYRLPATKYTEAREYATWLINHSEDVAAYRQRTTRRF
jgi:phosphatidylserine/phosphatidylglycerophosphate/cardiolipin synthase-like enzyme